MLPTFCAICVNFCYCVIIPFFANENEQEKEEKKSTRARDFDRTRLFVEGNI